LIGGVGFVKRRSKRKKEARRKKKEERENITQRRRAESPRGRPQAAPTPLAGE
jgi:hypothetical protein